MEFQRLRRAISGAAGETGKAASASPLTCRPHQNAIYATIPLVNVVEPLLHGVVLAIEEKSVVRVHLRLYVRCLGPL